MHIIIILISTLLQVKWVPAEVLCFSGVAAVMDWILGDCVCRTGASGDAKTFVGSEPTPRTRTGPSWTQGRCSAGARSTAWWVLRGQSEDPLMVTLSMQMLTLISLLMKNPNLVVLTNLWKCSILLNISVLGEGDSMCLVETVPFGQAGSPLVQIWATATMIGHLIRDTSRKASPRAAPTELSN